MTYDGLDRQKRWIFPSKTNPGSADQGDFEKYDYDANANRPSLRKRDGLWRRSGPAAPDPLPQSGRGPTATTSSASPQTPPRLGGALGCSPRAAPAISSPQCRRRRGSA
jgi:hypothetical protein